MSDYTASARGHALLTDDEASDLADELSAAGPFAFELPSYEAVTSRQWLYNRRDGYTPQEIRQEYNRDIEDDAVRVTCAGCGDTYRVIEPPAGEWFCELCRISEVS
jgi:hypothetical protein